MQKEDWPHSIVAEHSKSQSEGETNEKGLQYEHTPCKNWPYVISFSTIV